MKHALLNPNYKRVIIVIIIISKWAEYCTEQYSRQSYGANAFLDCNRSPGEDIQPILLEEVEIAPKTEKSSGVDNIPAELIAYYTSRFIQAGG